MSQAEASLTFDPSRFLLEQGVFCDQPNVGSVDAPDTVAGVVELFAETPEFQWFTKQVPAVPGISFGIRTRALDGAYYPGVTITLTHPPFAESGATRQSYVSQLGGDGVSINAYTFDEPEEMARGTWTFTATQAGRVLYRAEFEVVSPAAQPHIAAACNMALTS